MGNSIYLGGGIKSAFCGGNVKEIWQGSNKIFGGGGGEFIILKNGVNDFGLTPSSGSWTSPKSHPSSLPPNVPYYDYGGGGIVKYTGDKLKECLSGNFTIDFWLDGSSHNDNSRFQNFVYIGGTKLWIQFDQCIGSTGCDWKVPSTTIRLSQTWHHIAFVVKEGLISVYVDGVLKKSGISFVIPESPYLQIMQRYQSYYCCTNYAQFSLRNYAVWETNFERPLTAYDPANP